MRRKIQRKPIRHIPERISQAHPTSEKVSIQTAITVLGGMAGFIVAILYVAGRFYLSGYLGAMNIPYFLTSYSIWEYAEVSWPRLIILLLAKLYAPLMLTAGVFIVAHLAIRISRLAFTKLTKSRDIDNFVQALNRIKDNLSYLLLFVIIMYLVSVFSSVLLEINSSGTNAGQTAVLTRSYSIEVYSKESLPLDESQVMPNGLLSLYHYSNLKLLTHNNGKYYLFRDVDPLTCKPNRVFIVNDSTNTYFVLGRIVPVEGPCAVSPKIPSGPSVTPTPTP